jgi:nitrite reductase (NADH) large subunit
VKGADIRDRCGIVVVGGGMVGLRFAEAMAQLLPGVPIRVIGDEHAYDRTQLVHLLDGSRSRESLLRRNIAKPGRVMSIDRDSRTLRVSVSAQPDDIVPYDYLILATGARPQLPDVPGIEQATAFRRLSDAEHILSVAPRSATVIGGGALGLEMADALSARGCAVTVVHVADRLMERHLDPDSASALQRSLEAGGVRFVLDAMLVEVGEAFVELGSVRLQSDIVLVATGVRPDDELAKDAGLPCDNGIVVDDDMRTGDPRIFAVGDCVRHAGNSHCLLHTGYEQAHIAAKAIAGVERWPPRLQPAIMLKTRSRTFLMGRPKGEAIGRRRGGGMRRLWLEDGRLRAAVIIGTWDKIPLLRQAIESGERISLLRRIAFRCLGDPWPGRLDDPSNWSAGTVVCQCNGVTVAAVKSAIDAGVGTVEGIGRCCAAGTGCGGCRPLLSRLIGQAPQAVDHARALLAAAIATLIVLLLAAAGGLPYSPTFAWRWDLVWSDFIAKQVSGYALLAAGIVLALSGLARRREVAAAAAADKWRRVHTVAGLAALAGLLLHSGGRLGGGIALLLSLSWLGTVLAGGALSLVFARAHVLAADARKAADLAARRLHVYLLWPLPVLVSFHIAGAYLWH